MCVKLCFCVVYFLKIYFNCNHFLFIVVAFTYFFLYYPLLIHFLFHSTYLVLQIVYKIGQCIYIPALLLGNLAYY